jgi:hypothetical protein
MNDSTSKLLAAEKKDGRFSKSGSGYLPSAAKKKSEIKRESALISDDS